MCEPCLSKNIRFYVSKLRHREKEWRSEPHPIDTGFAIALNQVANELEEIIEYFSTERNDVATN